MRILMVSAPYRPCPPNGYGGVERICFWYVRELLKRGHEIFTACVPNSTVPGGQVIWYPPQGMPEHAHIRERPFWEYLKNQLEHVPFDLLHDHTHLKLPSVYCDRQRIPFLNTCHLPNPPFTKNAVALSEAHKQTVSPAAEVIHLGVPVDDYPFRDDKADYALYLGYIAPHKGVRLALDAAKELDMRLVMAGPTEHFPDYFKQEIEPHLDEKRTYLGELMGDAKLNYLSRARFIVLPIQWEEPGSTVAFEALACGTPVIGFNRGALKDIITTESIGALVDDYPALVEAMRDPPQDHQACRDHVAHRFDIPSRIDAYVRLYKRVWAGEAW